MTGYRIGERDLKTLGERGTLYVVICRTSTVDRNIFRGRADMARRLEIERAGMAIAGARHRLESHGHMNGYDHSGKRKAQASGAQGSKINPTHATDGDRHG